jgi:hypothetical protein
VPCRCDDETGLLKRCRFVKEDGGWIGKPERSSGYVHAGTLQMQFYQRGHFNAISFSL